MYLEQLQADPLTLQQKKHLVTNALKVSLNTGQPVEYFFKHYKRFGWSSWDAQHLLKIIFNNIEENWNDPQQQEEKDNFIKELERIGNLNK